MRPRGKARRPRISGMRGPGMIVMRSGSSSIPLSLGTIHIRRRMGANCGGGYDLRQLLEHPWILNPEGSAARSELQRELAGTRMPLRVGVEPYNYELQLRLIARGPRSRLGAESTIDAKRDPRQAPDAARARGRVSTGHLDDLSRCLWAFSVALRERQCPRRRPAPSAPLWQSS